MPASRSKTCRASVSETKRSPSGSAASASWSASERHRKEGTEFSSTRFSRAGTPALRKYFCASDVGRHLAPGGRHLDVVEAEDDRAVGIADLARRRAEGDRLVGRLAVLRVVALNAHFCPAPSSYWTGAAGRPILSPGFRPSGGSISGVRRPILGYPRARRPNSPHIVVNKPLRHHILWFRAQNRSRRRNALRRPTRTLQNSGNRRRSRHDSRRQIGGYEVGWRGGQVLTTRRRGSAAHREARSRCEQGKAGKTAALRLAFGGATQPPAPNSAAQSCTAFVAAS